MSNFTVEEWEGVLRGRAMPGDIFCGESLASYIHRMMADKDQANADLLEALQKAREDINWMLNSEQLLEGFVFDYIDAAIAKAKGQ